MNTEFDNNEIRCRMLGHPVSFIYCRTCNDSLFCRKIADCWHETIQIRQFLVNNYSAEQISLLEKPPKPKISSLYEMIQKAQKVSAD